MVTTTERFWSKVQRAQPDDCWEWRAAAAAAKRYHEAAA